MITNRLPHNEAVLKSPQLTLLILVERTSRCLTRDIQLQISPGEQSYVILLVLLLSAMKSALDWHTSSAHGYQLNEAICALLLEMVESADF